MKKKFNKLLSGRVLFYGYNDKNLPKEFKIRDNKVFVYSKDPKKLKYRSYSNVVRKLQSAVDLSIYKADLIFLDDYTTKVLMVGYPSTIPYVFVALDKPRYWIWMIIGILRRVIKKQIKIKKIIKFRHGKFFRPWLLLKTNNNNFIYHNYSISRKIGIKGLIKFLNKNRVKYVLLRSFERLHKTINKNADFDFLISDENIDFVKKYLQINSGSIGIDLWSVSEPSYNGITYFNPHLANEILKNSIKGPMDARIPNKKDYLLSFIYHSLYHKGVNAGIPSTNKNIEILKVAEDKYLKKIKQLAKDLKINIGNTMEELDEFLESQGWKPKIDTLSKIAVYNEWVRKKGIKKNDNLFPFSIFILRQNAIDNLIISSIKKYIKKNGYKILNYNSLTGSVRKNAKINLRGGNWKDNKFLEKTKKFEPSIAMIIYNQNYHDVNQFVSLKDKIRKKFDNPTEPSVVHSTDNENEFWDYLEYCFPKKIDFFKKKLFKINKKKPSLNILKKIDIWIYKIKHSTISLIKKEILKLISMRQ